MKDGLLSAIGYVGGFVAAIIGFLLMAVVGGAIIYGFTLALGLVSKALLG